MRLGLALLCIMFGWSVPAFFLVLWKMIDE
jgi:hypothetical protein